MKWTVRVTLEQAHEIYMLKMQEARELGDAQGENFWASHASTVRSVLDEVELCAACEELAPREAT